MTNNIIPMKPNTTSEKEEIIMEPIMEQQRKFSVEEILILTIRDLENISCPIGLVDAIGAPVNQATKNLKACVEAIRRDAEAQRQAQAAAEQARQEQEAKEREMAKNGMMPGGYEQSEDELHGNPPCVTEEEI